MNIKYLNTTLENLSIGKEGEDSTVIQIQGYENVFSSPRFWKSFNLRYGITENIFKYFSPAEVIAQLVAKGHNEPIKIAVENENQRALALSGNNNGFIAMENVEGIFREVGASNIEYSEGIISCDLEPQRNAGNGQIIGADQFANQFHIEVPVDGFGSPKFFLSLLRVLCQNGMIAINPAYETEVRIGAENAEWTLRKAIAAFNNEKGFHLLNRKIQLAQESFASHNEIYNAVRAIHNAGHANKAEIVTELAGVSHYELQQQSEKRAKRIESKLRVYDVLNMITEISTHASGIGERKELNKVVGSILSDDFDLEKSAEGQVKEFPDFYFKQAA